MNVLVPRMMHCQPSDIDAVCRNDETIALHCTCGEYIYEEPEGGSSTLDYLTIVDTVAEHMNYVRQFNLRNAPES